MTNKAEITPLPWNFTTIEAEGASAALSTLQARYIVHDTVGDCVYHAATFTKDDAAYIVRACNNFPKLVEALKVLTGVPDVAGWPETEDAIELLKQLGEK